MSNEDTKPTATRAGTLELGLELKDLPGILAGLEQVRVKALDAAAAVAAIGAPSGTTIEGIEIVADDTPALILAELRGLRAELAADREERQTIGIKTFHSE